MGTTTMEEPDRTAGSPSTPTRFEVFKRDRFTCAYCGRTPPEVLLHVDHVLPVAAGGSDDLTNLVTACQECNLGKADRMLAEGTAPAVPRAATEDLAERLEQAREYAELLQQISAIHDQRYWEVVRAWARAYGAKVVEDERGTHYSLVEDYGRFPEERSVRAILRRLPLHEVLEAVDITGGRWNRPTATACRYFYGICWRKIKGE